MKEIALKNGGVAIVDDEDFDELSKLSWLNTTHGYAVRYVGRTTIVRMHRVIMGVPQGYKRCVDHINGDKLDNRRSNLRICTKAENGRNRGMHRSNTSGFKGVHWCTSERKWRAVITMNRKKIFLGQFDTAQSAAEAYRKAALDLHGEFACIDR